MGFLREVREIEKQTAIELGQWTEERDVKMDATVSQRAEILAATFTLEELERMMGRGQSRGGENSNKNKSQAFPQPPFQRRGQRAKRQRGNRG
jgi:hypothetical protein